MECCTFTYRVYMVLSVENQASGYIGWRFIEISFEKNGCMLLNDIWCIFISKCSKCQLVHCFVKTADN